MTDPFVGRLTFLRVYSGKLTSGSYVLNATNGKKERISRLVQMYADQRNEIQEVFAGDNIYRAGGDEFTIISLNSTQEEFEKKIATLRLKACDPDWLYFAIGHYSDASTGKLRLALRYADENMYKDKNAFYEKYPDKKR